MENSGVTSSVLSADTSTSPGQNRPKKRNDPIKDKFVAVRNTDYEFSPFSACELMPTKHSKSALWKLLKKRKSPKSQDRLSAFIDQVRLDAQSGEVTAQTASEFRLLLSDLAPEVAAQFDELAETRESISLLSVKNVFCGGSDLARQLTCALAFAFSQSEAAETWGNFHEWPVKIVHDRIQSYTIWATSQGAVREMGEILRDLPFDSLDNDQLLIYNFLTSVIQKYNGTYNGTKKAEQSQFLSPNPYNDNKEIKIKGRPSYGSSKQNRSTRLSPASPISTYSDIREKVSIPDQDFIIEDYEYEYKARRPRKSVQSMNSRFVKLRQNNQGEIVTLPSFRNNDYDTFKSTLACSQVLNSPNGSVFHALMDRVDKDFMTSVNEEKERQRLLAKMETSTGQDESCI